MTVTIVGYLLNLACWERMQVGLLNQNQIWVKSSCTKELQGAQTQSNQDSRADVLIKFLPKKKKACQNHGICWCACMLCQSKHGVSSLFESFHDAIDGNDRSRLAILKLKCMQNTP